MQQRGMYRECPHCREPMRRDASVCPHCRRESAPMEYRGGRWWSQVENRWFYLDERANQWVAADEPPPSDAGSPPSGPPQIPARRQGFWSRRSKREKIALAVGALVLLGFIAVGAATNHSSVTNDTSRCLDVSPLLVSSIESGLKLEHGSLRFVQAVRSNDFHHVYFVAADIQGGAPGSVFTGRKDTGLWVTTSIDDDSGVVYSVDDVAKTFSNWLDGTATEAHFSESDDRAQQARKCSEADRP